MGKEKVWVFICIGAKYHQKDISMCYGFFSFCNFSVIPRYLGLEVEAPG